MIFIYFIGAFHISQCTNCNENKMVRGEKGQYGGWGASNKWYVDLDFAGSQTSVIISDYKWLIIKLLFVFFSFYG